MSATFSVYVPHVFPNFDKKYVAKVFSKFGTVKEVDFVAKQDRDGKSYNSVYVHLNNIDHTFQKVVQEKAEAGQSHTIIHDAPWHWIVLPNTAKKHLPGERKLKIDLGDAKAISSSNLNPNPTKDCPTKTLQVVEEFDEAMDEIERMIDAEYDEDVHLASFDRRYVQTIERENYEMTLEIDRLRKALNNINQMYQAEVSKVRSLYGVDL